MRLNSMNSVLRPLVHKVWHAPRRHFGTSGRGWYAKAKKAAEKNSGASLEAFPIPESEEEKKKASQRPKAFFDISLTDEKDRSVLK